MTVGGWDEVEDRSPRTLREKRASRDINRRLLILYGFVTLALVVFFVKSDRDQARNHRNEIRFERQIAANCVALNEAHAKFNAFLDQAILNAKNTQGLTPQQKAEAIAKDQPLHLLIQQCPPRP